MGRAKILSRFTTNLKWFDAPHEDLPHANAEHPNVAGGGETPEVDRLGCHPFDRKFAF